MTLDAAPSSVLLDAGAFEAASAADLLSLEAVVPEVDDVPAMPATGARRLAVEVLRQAISDAQQGDADAIHWIFGVPKPPVVGFTFIGLCHALEVDPDALRSRIRELPRLRRRWRPDAPKRIAA